MQCCKPHIFFWTEDGDHSLGEGVWPWRSLIALIGNVSVFSGISTQDKWSVPPNPLHYHFYQYVASSLAEAEAQRGSKLGHGLGVLYPLHYLVLLPLSLFLVQFISLKGVRMYPRAGDKCEVGVGMNVGLGTGWGAENELWAEERGWGLCLE